ncbi:MAG: TolC family outer membrane protein [Alphaproteobacteria bacterium]
MKIKSSQDRLERFIPCSLRYALLFFVVMCAGTFFVSIAQAQSASFESAAPQSVSPKSVSSESVSLQQVMQTAYEYSPVILAARQEVITAQESINQARALIRPNLSAQSRIYSEQLRSKPSTGSSNDLTKELGLDASQPIWTGGRYDAERSEAEARIVVAQSVLERAERDLFLSMMRVYLNLMQAREVLASRQKNEEILRTEYQGATERHELGAITLTDVHQARSRLSRAQAARVQAVDALSIAEENFVQITMMPPPAVMRFPSDLEVDLPQQLEAMIALAAQRNPDIVLAQNRKYLLARDIDIIQSERRPRVSAFASVTQQYDPQPGVFSQTRSEVIGMRADVALYQGGATLSRIREAQGQVKAQSFRIEDVSREVRRDVSNNFNSYVLSLDLIAAREMELQAAQSALEGVREEALSGQRTMLDVLDADRDVIEAEIAVLASRYEALFTRFSLWASIGVLTADNMAFGKI